MGRTYIVYDARVWGFGNLDIGVLEFDTDNATVLLAASSLKEAKSDIREFYPDGVILSYNDDDGILTDERFEWAMT